MNYARMIAALLLIVLAIMISGPAQAFDVNYITHQSRGNVTVTQAKYITKMVNYYSELYSVNPVHIYKIMRVESRFDPKAKSNRSAVGLMQVIPRWHRDKLMDRDPFDITTNIEVGIRIWAEYLARAKSVTEALAMYSGGAEGYAEKVLGVSRRHYPQPYPGSDDTQYTQLPKVKPPLPSVFFKVVQFHKVDDSSAPYPHQPYIRKRWYAHDTYVCKEKITRCVDDMCEVTQNSIELFQ